jgi:uncharacterized membrane protein (DUF106 family)
MVEEKKQQVEEQIKDKPESSSAVTSDKSEVQVEAKTKKSAKKSFLQTKKGQILVGTAAILMIIYATFFTTTPLGPEVFGLKPVYAIFAISVILSIFVTLVYKFATDQVVMRELKKELKKHQVQMKEHRSDSVKISEISKKSMDVNMKYMKQTMKPMLITMIPFFAIFQWMRGIFGEIIIFNLPMWPHTLGWLGTYIIFSMIFTTVFRKLLNVV